MKNLRFLLLGVLFGVILLRSGTTQWLHGVAVVQKHPALLYLAAGFFAVTFLLLIQYLKNRRRNRFDAEKSAKTGQDDWSLFLGEVLFFGAGWALTSACPGPDASFSAPTDLSTGAVLGAALLAGLWTFTALRARLSHSRPVRRS